MSVPEFVFVSGLAVLFVTAVALGCARFFTRDAATRDAVLFATICLCLAAPLSAMAFDSLGLSIQIFHPRSVSGQAQPDLEITEYAPEETDGLELVRDASEPELTVVQRTTSPRLSGTAEIPQKSAISFDAITWWGIYLWGFGASALLIRMLLAWRSLGLVVAQSTPIHGHFAQVALSRAAEIVRAAPKPYLGVADDIGVPIAVGILRPVVLLPSTWNQLAEDQLIDVLAHELAHLSRRDPVKLFLQQVATAFYWPIVTLHIVNRKLNDAREEVCDNGVLGTRDAISYGDTLLRVATLATTERMPGLAALGFLRQTNRLEQRVAGLLEQDRDRQIRPSFSKLIPIVGILMLLVAAVCLFAASPPAREGLDTILPYEAGALAAVPTDQLNAPSERLANVGDKTDTVADNNGEAGAPQTWEISKIYDASFLRTYLRDNEALPKPIVVPSVRGQVVDLNGQPVARATLVSHTPRQWVSLEKLMGENPHISHGPVLTTKTDGKFGLPQRKEPYRVLVVHDSGVASVTHEELIRANGKVVLQNWASVTGTFVLGGEPQVNETVKLYFNTVPWSYSRGGPRLTTDYTTTTDAEGRFSFEKVIPLSGRAHHLRPGWGIGRGTKYQCQNGRETQIEIGAGATVSGTLKFSPDIDNENVRVRVHPMTQPLPCPKEIAESRDREAIRKWRREWSGTKEGYALTDMNFDLANSSVPGTLNSEGTFVVHGVKRGAMKLRVYIRGKARLLEKEFDSSGIPSETIDLGDISVPAAEAAEARPAALPNMVVRLEDVDGNPVVGADVRFWDREGYFHDRKMAFEMQDRVTDATGTADFGRPPHEFGHLRISPIGKLAGCYNVISIGSERTTESSPPRANMRFKQARGELEITVTMAPRVDLEFKIVDAETDEIVYWPEIYYQDSATKRWWVIAIVDGSKRQHNFIPISPTMTKETIGIFTVGYETEIIHLPDDLDLSKPIRREVRLKPLPKLRFNLLQADGEPAKFAMLRFKYPDGVNTMLHIAAKADENGICEMKFPPATELATLYVTHGSGSSSMPLKSLLADSGKGQVERTITLTGD